MCSLPILSSVHIHVFHKICDQEETEQIQTREK